MSVVPVAAPGEPDPGMVLGGRILGPEPEDEVVKAGLLSLSEVIGTDGLHDFPRRPNGTPLLTRQGFFERLLRGHAVLQDCAAADTSAAEADVKRLTLQQLIAIRCIHLDFVPVGAGQVSKANFLKLIERWTVTLLAERILGDEATTLTDANRALVMKHVMLIYGASRRLGGEEPVGSEWWLLAVGGTRRYLHLPRCEASSLAPAGSVYCYRILASPSSRDRNCAPALRWQVQLVDKPEEWKPGTEQIELGSDKDSVQSGGTPTTTTPTSAHAAPQSQGADIDEFFNALLAEPPLAQEEPKKLTPSEVRKSGTLSGASIKAGKEVGDSTPRVATSMVAVSVGAKTHVAASVVVQEPVPKSKEELDPGAVKEKDKEEGGSTSQVDNIPCDVRQERLCAALIRFYRWRQSTDKISNVEKIAQKYKGDGVVSLWAALGGKYSLPPPTAVQWLAGTLDQYIPVQWAKEDVPSAVNDTLQKLACRTSQQTGCASVKAVDKLGNSPHDEELRSALDLGETEVVSALAFCGSCSDPALRPKMWRALLGWLPATRAGEQCSVGSGYNCREEDEQVCQRRSEYFELRARMTAAVPPLPARPDDVEKASGEEAGEATDTLASGAALRTEVEGDAKAAWRGEAFMGRADVVAAIIAITLTHAWQCSQYVPGSCELATVLLFAMSCGGTTSIADAEADTFWCFSQLMAEVQDSIAADSGLAGQVRRTHELLRTYDPPVAELLDAHGLGALPALRLGAALCTRSGFALADCVRIWDTLLADPRRFDFCEYVVVALVLLIRGDLLQRGDVGSLCETLLAAPNCVDVNALLRTACAICAFERRCVVGVANPFPPRPAPCADFLDGCTNASGGFDAAVAVAQTKLSSLWGKVRAVSSEAWALGHAAANEAVVQAPSWKAQARRTFGEAVASAASAAGTAATVAASAAGKAATSATAALEAVTASRPMVSEGLAGEGSALEDKANEPPTVVGGAASQLVEVPSAEVALFVALPGDRASQQVTIKEGPPALIEAPPQTGRVGPPQLIQLPE